MELATKKADVGGDGPPPLIADDAVHAERPSKRRSALV
jgi:hypothetical protein